MLLPRSLDILDSLIAFPTVSRNSNLDLIAYVRDLLAASGIAARIVGDHAGTKANLYAVIGPADLPGVLLSGHTDVVPTDGQSWASDPFRMQRRDDRLFGRGTADMKGFIACMLANVEEAARRELRRPLHIALSYDEEIGCVGVRRLLDTLTGMAHPPAMCIVGEPTSMHTVIAHKGKIAGRITCLGHECHSSQAPDGLNAIHLAADMVAALRTLQADIATAGAKDTDFTVPFTTVHVGTIRGGTALNIVPRECVLDFEIRSLPSEDPQVYLGRLLDRAAALTRMSQARFSGTGVHIEVVNDYPSLDTDPGDAVVTRLDALTGACGSRKLHKADFGTEGGLFRQRLGIPTLVCGPGNIGEAHKPDEFIEIDQMAQCSAMLRRLADELAA